MTPKSIQSEQKVSLNAIWWPGTGEFLMSKLINPSRTASIASPLEKIA